MTNYKRNKTYPNNLERGEINSSWKLLESTFVLNCSSSEWEIMNDEGGIYREGFHQDLD
jgi:hypothetical protein